MLSSKYDRLPFQRRSEKILKATEFWQGILGQLEVELPSHVYKTWLSNTRGHTLTDDSLTIEVPSPFIAECLEKKMYQIIHRTVERVNSRSLDIHFQIPGSKNGNGVATKRLAKSASNYPPIGQLEWPLNSRYTFDSFVVGPCNDLAYSGAQSVASHPGKTYNPLFIYSDVGLGKTHLLQAIGHQCEEAGRSFIYVTGEQFTNEYIFSIQSRTTNDFRNKYRTPDVLLIDDIQFISGKEQTQEGFFHTFNDLHSSGRQLILSSDRPPTALAPLADRLRSRFESGLMVDMQPPDLETRLAILSTKAREHNIDPPSDILEAIAKTAKSNIRELEGHLNKLLALSQMRNSPVDWDLVAQALPKIQESTVSVAQPDMVIRTICQAYSVSKDHLISKKRTRHIAAARQIAMFLLYTDSCLSITEIGRILQRNHSTVSHAIKKMTALITEDSQFSSRVKSLKRQLVQTYS